MTISPARPTRRTLVRGAAWSMPVVTIVAAAPAFAASLTPSTGVVSGNPVKWGNGPTKHVSWDLTLTNGPVAIDSITIVLSYAPSGGGTFTTFVVRGFTPTDNTWAFTTVPSSSSPYLVNTTHGAMGADDVAHVHFDFAGHDASNGTVTATTTITYAGSSTPVSLPMISRDWSPGSEHSH